MKTNEKATLSVDFQDGFKDDTVILVINNVEVLRKDNVTTDLRISLATAPSESSPVRFHNEVPTGQTKIEIMVPTRNRSFSTTVDIQSDKYYGVSIVDPQSSNPKIDFREFKQPPRYL